MAGVQSWHITEEGLGAGCWLEEAERKWASSTEVEGVEPRLSGTSDTCRY